MEAQEIHDVSGNHFKESIFFGDFPRIVVILIDPKRTKMLLLEQNARHKLTN